MFSKVVKAILGSCKSDLSYSSINMEWNIKELETYILVTLRAELFMTDKHIVRHSKYLFFLS